MKKNIFIIALLMGVAHSVSPLVPTNRVNLDSKCPARKLKYPIDIYIDKIKPLKDQLKYCEYILNMIESKILQETGIKVDILNKDFHLADIVPEHKLVKIITEMKNIDDCGLREAFYYRENEDPFFTIMRLVARIKHIIPEKIKPFEDKTNSYIGSLERDLNHLERSFNEFLETPTIKFYLDLEKQLIQSDPTLEKYFRKTFLSKMKNILSASQYMFNFAKEYAAKGKEFVPFHNNIYFNYDLILLKIREAEKYKDNKEFFDYYYIIDMLEDEENTGNIKHYLEDSRIKKLIKEWKLAKEQKLLEKQIEEIKEIKEIKEILGKKISKNNKRK